MTRNLHLLINKSLLRKRKKNTIEIQPIPTSVGLKKVTSLIILEILLNELGIKPRSFKCNMEIDFNELVFENQIS